MIWSEIHNICTEMPSASVRAVLKTVEKTTQKATRKPQDYNKCILQAKVCTNWGLCFSVLVLSAMKLAQAIMNKDFQVVRFSNLHISTAKYQSRNIETPRIARNGSETKGRVGFLLQYEEWWRREFCKLRWTRFRCRLWTLLGSSTAQTDNSSLWSVFWPVEGTLQRRLYTLFVGDHR